MVDRLCAYADARTSKVYPKTTCALEALQEAMRAEMPVHRHRCQSRLSKKRSSSELSNLPTASGPSRKHYQRSLRLKKENDQLRAKLARLTTF